MTAEQNSTPFIHLESEDREARVSLDAYTQRWESGELPGPFPILVSKSRGEAIRCDLNKNNAIALMNWLATQLGFEAVHMNTWESFDWNLLKHYRGENHNRAKCRACKAGHDD